MHAEYAVEPRAVGGSWQNCLYLLEKFGFDKGRLISQFPKTWLREAYEAARDLPPIEKARVEVKLNQAKRTSFLKSGRPYAPGEPWLKNALDQHAVTPFHAIIALENPSALAHVLKCDELDETHHLLVAPATRAIRREATDLAGAMKTMLKSASSIAFVDPYYSPFSPAHQSTLRECLSIVAQTNATATCEIHHKERDGAPPVQAIEQEARRYFAGVIPNGLVLRVYRWKEKARGEDFHARYLLTDKGGLGIDAGFSADGAHQTTAMSLLPHDFAQAKRAAFQPTATVYELVQPIIQIESNGNVTRL